jgi:hypothetical protein
MGPGGVMTIVVVVLLIDFVVVWAVLSMVRDSFFEPLHRMFPPRAMLEAAVEKRFQSMSSGMVNMGGCMHIAVDAEHVHVAPAWAVRRLGGRAFSVPLAEVSVNDRAKLARAKWGWWPVAGRFGTVEVSAPAWMFREVSRRQAEQAAKRVDSDHEPEEVNKEQIA